MPDPDRLDVIVHGATGAAGVEVSWTGSTWAWSVRAADGRIVQQGEGLMTVRRSGVVAAVRVLIRFLLAAADQPIDELSEAATEWAVQHRAGLRAALRSP